MTEIIEFPSAKTAEKLFQDYTAKARKAQESLDYRDGVAAGKAWAKFISVFHGMGNGPSSAI